MDDDIWIEIERIRNELDRKWNQFDEDICEVSKEDIMEYIKLTAEDALIRR